MTNTLSISKNHLSIELGSGFCFLSLGRKDNATIIETAHITLSEHHPDFASILNHPIISGSTIHTASLSFANSKFCLLPDAIFDKDNRRASLALNCQLMENEEVFHKPLHTLQAQLIFAANQKVVQLFMEAFPEISFSHTALHFIQQIEKINHASEELHISVYPQLFYCCSFLSGQVIIINSFQFRSPEDLLYYAVYVAEQSGLKPEKVKLCLSGLIEKGDSTSQLLEKYFNEVHYFNEAKELVKSIQLSDKKHFINPQLIQQFKCEL